MTKSKGAARLATFAAVAPILVAAVRGALDGWTPTGDDAFSGIRAWDVFTKDIPLLGTWSSASTYTTLDVSHPGPIHFDLLAVPVRVLGHGAGTAIGMGLINAFAVLGIAWLLHRLQGPAATAAGMGLTACLTWAMGSEMLYDPWNPYATLLPFACFLVAVWGIAAGDRAALLVTVVAGSYVLQTHLSYSILVPGTALVGIAVLAVRLWRRRRADREAWPARRRQVLRWGGGAVALGLVLWLQPIIQQFTTDEQGNLTGLLRSATDEGVRTPGLGRTLRAVGGTLAVPPAWLPPSYADPSFEIDGSGHPTWLAALGLAVLALLLAVLGRRAQRRGSTTMALGALVGLVTMALGLLTALRAPIVFEMVPTYFRWMWPMGLFLWLLVAVALLDEAAAWYARRSPAPAEGDGPGAPEAADPEVEVEARVEPTPDADGEGDVAAGPDGESDGDVDVDAEAEPAVRRRPLPPLRPRRLPQPVGLAVPGLVLAVVAGAATVPRVDHGSASPPWTIEVVDEIEGPLAEALEDEEGPLLVELSMHLSSLGAGPALFAVLQEAGVEFYVSDWPLIRQLGEDRRYEDGDADRLLRVTGDPSRSSAREGEVLVAAYRPLSRPERREMARLNDEVEALVVEHGLTWSGDAEAVFEALHKPDRMDELEEWVEDSPEYLVKSGLLRTLWTGGDVEFAGHPLLDPTVYRPEVMDRWAELQTLQDRSLTVYLSDVPPPEDDDEDDEDESDDDPAGEGDESDGTRSDGDDPAGDGAPAGAGGGDEEEAAAALSAGRRR